MTKFLNLIQKKIKAKKNLPNGVTYYKTFESGHPVVHYKKKTVGLRATMAEAQQVTSLL